MGQPTSRGANSWAYMGLVGVHLEQLAPARNPGHLDLGAKIDRNLIILAILDSVAEVSKVFGFFLLCPRAPPVSLAFLVLVFGKRSLKLEFAIRF